MATKLFFLLFVLCVLPAVLADGGRRPISITGRVYCDACQAGFETSKCFNIPRAKVVIKCFDSKSYKLKFSVGATTDSKGRYEVLVEDDHHDQICNVYAVSSPIPSCRTVDPKRNMATVILTRDNGVCSDVHHANAIGFLQDKPAAGCKELLEQLLKEDA